MPKQYEVGGTIYEFPDSYSDDQVTGILAKQGLIKRGAPAPAPGPVPSVGPGPSTPPAIPNFDDWAVKSEVPSFDDFIAATTPKPQPQPNMGGPQAPPMPAPSLPAELAPPKPTALDQPPQQFKPPPQPASNIGPLPQVTGPTDYTPPAQLAGAPGSNQPGNAQRGSVPPGIPKPPLPYALQGPPRTPSVAENLGLVGPPTAAPIPAGPQSGDVDASIGLPHRPDVEASLRDPQFGQMMSSAWQGFADQIPGGQTPSEKVQNAIARTALGLMSPKSLAIMLGAEGATAALSAAVNSTRGVALLSRIGGSSAALRQAVDIAAQNAVPIAFRVTAGVQGTKAAIEYAKTGDPEKAVEAAANIILGAAGGSGLRAGIKATGEMYPPPPVEATGTRSYEGAPPAPSPEVQAQAPGMAQALEQQGHGLAAQSWRDVANHGRSDLPYDIDAGGRRLTVQPLRGVRPVTAAVRARPREQRSTRIP
jgi:hypothetical protein